MNDLTCEQLDGLLPELFDGRSAPDVEAAAAHHLATCGDCRIVVDDLERVGEIYREHGRLALPEDARARIRALLEQG